MTNYPFNQNFPNPPDNPSDDVGGMQVNSQSTFGIIAEDHFGFGVNNGGLHQKARLVNQLGIPSGTASGMGTIYTKTVATSSTTNESTLFYNPDASLNEYQLSRTIAPKGASFGKNNIYSSVFTGGWTFLPGGMILQYGQTPVLTSGSQVPFIVQYTNNVFSVTAILLDTNSGKVVQLSNFLTASFTVNFNPTGSGEAISWMAIGV